MARPRDQPALRPRLHGRDCVCQRHGVRKNRLAVGLRGHHVSGNARPNGGRSGAGGGHRRCGTGGELLAECLEQHRHFFVRLAQVAGPDRQRLFGKPCLGGAGDRCLRAHFNTEKGDLPGRGVDRRRAGGPGSGRCGHARRKGRGGEELRDGRGGGCQGDADLCSVVALGRPAPMGRGSVPDWPSAQSLHPSAESEGRGPG